MKANIILLPLCLQASQDRFWKSLWANSNLNRPALAVVSGEQPQQDTASQPSVNSPEMLAHAKPFWPFYNPLANNAKPLTSVPVYNNIQTAKPVMSAQNSVANNWFSNLWNKKPSPRPVIQTEQQVAPMLPYQIQTDFRAHNFRIKLSDFDCDNNTHFSNNKPSAEQIQNLLLHSVDTYRLRTFGDISVTQVSCGSLIVDFAIKPYRQDALKNYIFSHIIEVRKSVARAILPNYNGRTALDYAGTMSLGEIEHEPKPDKAPVQQPDISDDFDSKITSIIKPLVIGMSNTTESFEDVVGKIFEQIKIELPDFDFTNEQATNQLFSTIMKKIQESVDNLTSTDNSESSESSESSSDSSETLVPELPEVSDANEPLIITDNGIEGVFDPKNEVVESILEASDSDPESMDMASLIELTDEVLNSLNEDFIPEETISDFSEPMTLTQELTDELNSENDEDETPVLDALENVVFEEITKEVDSVLNDDEGTLVPLVAAINEVLDTKSDVQVDIIETAKAISEELVSLENDNFDTPILDELEDTVVKTLYKENNAGPLTDLVSRQVEETQEKLASQEEIDLDEDGFPDDTSSIEDREEIIEQPASAAEVSQALSEAITDSILLNSEIVDFGSQEQKIITDLEPFKAEIIESANTLVSDVEEGVDVMTTFEDIKHNIAEITQTVAEENNADSNQAIEDASSQVIDLVLAVEERRRRRK